MIVCWSNRYGAETFNHGYTEPRSLTVDVFSVSPGTPFGTRVRRGETATQPELVRVSVVQH